MRRILFAMIALGALAWLAAPVSASHYHRSHGGNSSGWRQGGHGHHHSRFQPRFVPRCGMGYGNHGGRSHGGRDHGGNRGGSRGGSFGIRY